MLHKERSVSNKLFQGIAEPPFYWVIWGLMNNVPPVFFCQLNGNKILNNFLQYFYQRLLVFNIVEERGLCFHTRQVLLILKYLSWGWTIRPIVYTITLKYLLFQYYCLPFFMFLSSYVKLFSFQFTIVILEKNSILRNNGFSAEELSELWDYLWSMIFSVDLKTNLLVVGDIQNMW